MKPMTLALAAVLFFLVSCAAGTPRWGAGENAINLCFEGSRMLNTRGGEPHPLAVSVYQLRDPGRFKALTQTEEGMNKLLECVPFDASVAAASRVVVQPGKVRRVSLDRAEGARYVGLVAGYYTLDRTRDVRVFSIPLQADGLVFVEQVPAPLDITLRLGSRGFLPDAAARQTSTSGAREAGAP